MLLSKGSLQNGNAQAFSWQKSGVGELSTRRREQVDLQGPMSCDAFFDHFEKKLLLPICRWRAISGGNRPQGHRFHRVFPSDWRHLRANAIGAHDGDHRCIRLGMLDARCCAKSFPCHASVHLYTMSRMNGCDSLIQIYGGRANYPFGTKLSMDRGELRIESRPLLIIRRWNATADRFP